MLKARIYIIQLLCILALLCGYFLSDPPDSLSVMHFNLNPDSPYVITNAIKKANGQPAQNETKVSQNHPSRKTNVPKFISYEKLLPVKYVSGYHYVPVKTVAYSAALPETYSYLFFAEINPPPPKSQA